MGYFAQDPAEDGDLVPDLPQGVIDVRGRRVAEEFLFDEGQDGEAVLDLFGGPHADGSGFGVGCQQVTPFRLRIHF